MTHTKQTNDPMIVAPSPTPFNKKDEIDYAAIEYNVTKWSKTKLSGYVLGSENGEEGFLNLDEKIKIIEKVKEVNEDKKLIIAGVDSPSIKETLKLSEMMSEAGADLIRIRIPRNRKSVPKYFKKVLDDIQSRVIIIHQMDPGNFDASMTKVGADPEIIGDITNHDKVFGYIASAQMRFEAKVKEYISEKKRFWVGNSMLIYPGVFIGANGACMMFGNIAPNICMDIIRLSMKNDFNSAKILHDKCVYADWNILSNGAAGLKYAMDIIGYKGGLPRAPMPDLEPSEKSKIVQGLKLAKIV